MSDHGMEIDEDEAIYVYGFGDDAIPLDLERPGLESDDRAVCQPVGSGRLRALVQPVDLATWAGPEAEERLQDVEWVAPRACRHEAAVEALQELGPVFPLRFGTLFQCIDALEEQLEDHEGRVLEFLDEARTHQEWSVKGLLDRQRAETVLGNEADAASTASSGADYLKQRAETKNGADLVGDWLERLAPVLYEAYGNVAARSTVRTSVDDGRGEAETAFHWAFWVPNDALDAFDAVRDHLAPHLDGSGLDLEVEGPWPAYSFRPSLGDAPTTERGAPIEH